MTEFAQKLITEGLTLAEFCRLTGTPRRTAEDWKSGRRNPPAIVFAWFEMYEKHVS